MARPVGTLVKAMDLLDALAETGPVGVMALSRRLAMDKSAVSRLLTTLKSRQYVRVVTDGRYDLGLRLFELGQRLVDRLPFRKAVMPYVDALAAATGETAYAAHYHQDRIAYLYDCVSTQEVRLGDRVGIRCVPWNDVAGRAILAHRDEPAVLGALAAARRTERKRIPSRDTFRRELARIRRCGYAVDRDSDKCLIAAPLPNDHADADVALVVGGPSSRIKRPMIKSIGAIVMHHAAEASRALGRSSG